MKIGKYEAINALYEGNVTQLSDGTFEYHSGGSIPTEKEIEAKLAELQASYDAIQYKSDRLKEYPPIGDQLDALYHAGVFPKEMADKIKAVKDKHKKPE